MTLDHVCLRVNDMEWNLGFFKDVFDFHVDRYAGDEQHPSKVWFKEGLQLNQCSDTLCGSPAIFDHLGVCVPDVNATLKKLASYGGKVTEAGENWVMMPNGLYLEILPSKQ